MVGLLVALVLTFGVKAGLDARQQVPPQVVKAPAATGTVSGTLVVGARSTLRWQFTVRGLTGPPTALELRRGRLGRRGPRLATLCAPCARFAKGSTRLSPLAASAIRAGSAYVVVRTRKNPVGEIRGQLRILGGA